LWLDWRQRGIEIHPVPGKVVHRYHYREGSTSNPHDKCRRRENIGHYQEVQRRILVNHAEPASPRVTALMLTGKCVERYPLARVAVACFQRQSWPDKELVIVNHGPVSLADGSPNIREIRVERTPEMTLGDLRNLSRAHAQGDYVIQWDDDDYHHARRIETMMEHRDKAEIVTVGWQIRFNICCGTAFYHHLPGGQQMAILHRANAPFQYPRLDTREDTIFINQFNTKCVIDNDPDDGLGPLLYVRLFHQRNIWDERHVMEHLAGKRGVLEVKPAHRAALRKIEAEYRAAGLELPPE
jgi:glycosyltransferase involved in cell wall biosynthesis